MLEQVLRLDTLGDHRQAEVPRQVDGCAHDRLGTRVAQHRAHEGAVDLDLARGERGQVVDRGVAGTEVVHGDVDAEVAQRAQDGDRPLRVDHRRALGDLYRDALLSYSVPREQLVYLPAQLPVEQ